MATTIEFALARGPTLVASNIMRPKSSLGLFFGKQQRRKHVGEFILTDSIYEPHLTLPKHVHELAYFCIVLRGAYTECYGRVSQTYSPATVVFHPAGETHSDHFHEAGGHIFNVAFSPGWLQRTSERSRVLTCTDHMQGGRAAWIAKQLYCEFQEPDDLSPLAIEALAIEVLVEASRRARHPRQTNPPRWLRHVTDLLHDQFAERLSLDQIAAAAGVHPMHLARVFQRHCLCTVGEYIRKLRVEFVCQELSESDAPLVEIALAAGFSDQSHFCKSFRSHTGLTPSQFRNISRSR
jgi:AraC family transcriptional regulator